MTAPPHQPKRFSAQKVLDDIRAGRDVTITQPAIIEGDFILSALEVKGLICIENTTFTGRVDLSHSTFNNVVSFKNSTFSAQPEPTAFNSATFRKDIFLDDATFEGQFDFSYSIVEGVLHSNAATFNADANFTGTHFRKSIYFASANFGGNADFYGATEIDGDAIFNRAEFRHHAHFYSTQIHGIAYFLCAKFRHVANFSAVEIGCDAEFLHVDFYGIASFNDAQIEGNAAFWACDFNKDADFSGSSIGGFGEFVGTHFHGRADFVGARFALHINCNSIQDETTREASSTYLFTRLGRSVGITPEDLEAIIDRGMRQVIFMKDANFLAARIGGNVYFGNVLFGAENHETESPESNVSFNDARIDGSALFSKATFNAKVDFLGAQIEGQADFSYVQFLFKDGTDWDVSFNGLQTKKSFFCRDVRFAGKVDFVSASIGGNAEFTRSSIGKEILFSNVHVAATTLFDSVECAGEALFGNTRFHGMVYLTSSEFSGTVNFGGTHFAHNVNLRWTTFNDVLNWSNVSCEGTIYVNEHTRFENGLDLRGSTYYSIDPSENWQILLKPLGKPYLWKTLVTTLPLIIAWPLILISEWLLKPQNRFPTWNQLFIPEPIDEIRFDRQPFTQLEETFRRAGRDQLANRVYFEGRRLHSASMDYRSPLAWLVDRFLWLATGYGVQLWRLLILLFVIMALGTLLFLTDGSVVTNVQPPDTPIPVDLDWGQSFGFALKQFLPIGIPFGDDWSPSAKPILAGISSMAFATIIKIIGWILVPVGVSGVAGWLKRE